MGREKKGLHVNMGKMKVLMSGSNLSVIKKSGKHPCAICLTGTGSNSIFCDGCSLWVHNKCSGISGTLQENLDFCCLDISRKIDGIQ